MNKTLLSLYSENATLASKGAVMTISGTDCKLKVKKMTPTNIKLCEQVRLIMDKDIPEFQKTIAMANELVTDSENIFEADESKDYLNLFLNCPELASEVLQFANDKTNYVDCEAIAKK